MTYHMSYSVVVLFNFVIYLIHAHNIILINFYIILFNLSINAKKITWSHYLLNVNYGGVDGT